MVAVEGFRDLARNMKKKREAVRDWFKKNEYPSFDAEPKKFEGDIHVRNNFPFYLAAPKKSA